MALATTSTDAVKTVPDIIKAASASPLGILALIIVVLGVLAYVYFKSAPVNIRVGIFVALLIGASLYAVAITNAAQNKGPDGLTPPPGQTGVTTIDGMVADSIKGDSIDLVTVTTALSTSPAITDSNGGFHLKIRTPDLGESVVLHVSKSGYESLDWTVTPPIVSGIRILLKKEHTAANGGAPKVNLLFRWFVGLGMDDAVWNHAVVPGAPKTLAKHSLPTNFTAAKAPIPSRDAPLC